MLMTNDAGGNLAQVRDALQGITGVAKEEMAPKGPLQEWYMVVVRPNHELEAVDSFRRHGTRAYWPSYERLVASRQRINGHPVRRMVRTGIVPGYVFSPGSPGSDFTGLIENVVGAVDIVRTFSGQTLFVTDRDIDIIRKIDKGLNTPLPTGTVHNFKPGEKVRFSDDLLQHWPVGKVAKLAREGRLSVDVDLMGRKVSITVFPHQIERV